MKKVLIVEDNVDISSNIGYMLSQLGYLAFVAKDGAEGIAMAKEKLPDVIIMDLMLPDMMGGEVVSTIKKHSPCNGVPVIFLTALMSKEDAGEINTIMVDGKRYPALAKPFDFPQLLKIIEKQT